MGASAADTDDSNWEANVRQGSVGCADRIAGDEYTDAQHLQADIQGRCRLPYAARSQSDLGARRHSPRNPSARVRGREGQAEVEIPAQVAAPAIVTAGWIAIGSGS